MTCPICDGETNHRNNHVRMSSGDGHGPQGTYPDGYDKETGELVEGGNDPDDVEADGGADAQGDELDAGDVGLDDDGDEGDDGDLGESNDPDDLLDDEAADSSEYNCGNCGHGLDYLGGADRDGGGKECPECGERLYWSMVEP